MGKKLYVGNMSYSTTDDSLREQFEQVGTVESAKVIIDRETNRSKGFGFVEMATDEEAEAAIEKFDGVTIDGRALKVSEAKPMEPRSGGGGGRGGGGRGGAGGGGGGRSGGGGSRY
jgi:RNA recognition motif-containing protein